MRATTTILAILLLAITAAAQAPQRRQRDLGPFNFGWQGPMQANQAPLPRPNTYAAPPSNVPFSYTRKVPGVVVSRSRMTAPRRR